MATKFTSVRKSVLTAVFIAMCVVLPMAFHTVPNAGSIFLPMHIPVLLCGLMCGWPYGLVCGLLGPFLSSFTGMPPMAVLPGMMVECGVYGLVTGLMMKFIRTGKLLPDVYISMAVAMVLGRVVGGIAKALFIAINATGDAFTLGLWATSYFVTALPGIAVHLILVPLLVTVLMKTKVIPSRYSKVA